jgi:hypothetical protein
MVSLKQAGAESSGSSQTRTQQAPRQEIKVNERFRALAISCLSRKVSAVPGERDFRFPHAIIRFKARFVKQNPAGDLQRLAALLN